MSLKNFLNRVIVGDCIEKMDLLAPNSVDFSNDEILAELKRRNSSQCATQEILDSNLADYRKASETERGSGQGDGGGGY